MKELVTELNGRFRGVGAPAVIKWFVKEYSGSIAFSSSFGAEDQVIVAMLAGLKAPPRLFTLDTGRLFQETYDLMHITEQKYGIRFELFFPESNHVEKMVHEKGINLFYESVNNRQLCCHIRKIEPLKRALTGVSIWITGLRRTQSVTRSDVSLVEWDSNYQLLKLNPIIDWSEEEVWSYIREHKVPYNELHDRGYPSIGCQPCTRAISPGDDLRAGRWWWENPEHKECGLHNKR